MQLPEALIVDDSPTVLQSLTYQLHREGFLVREATTVPCAVAELRRFGPDLVLLAAEDDGRGRHACGRLREQAPEAVIIVLSASDDEEDKVRAFRAGADDYVTKPFSKRELMARVRAALKRSRRSRHRMLRAGDLEVNLDNYSVTAGGEPVKLTVKQFELLAALAAAPGELKTREALAREVWGHEALAHSRTIDVHARGLRGALAEHSTYDYIHTVRGLGLMFQPRSARDGAGRGR